jgi:hypothetical protein
MRFAAAGLVLLCGIAANSPATPPPSRVSFAAEVRPILERRCQPCHFAGGKMYERLPFDEQSTTAQARNAALHPDQGREWPRYDPEVSRPGGTASHSPSVIMVSKLMAPTRAITLSHRERVASFGFAQDRLRAG